VDISFINIDVYPIDYQTVLNYTQRYFKILRTINAN
jgi:hypothetical protein